MAFSNLEPGLLRAIRLHRARRLTEGNAQQPPHQQQPAVGPTSLVLTHVIDATGAAAKPNLTVIITGDHISKIGKSDAIRVPKHAQVVDATAKFLIPGLWDMHVHWYEQDYLPLFIANGVTGIRIMSSAPPHHEWRKQLELSKGTAQRAVYNKLPKTH